MKILRIIVWLGAIVSLTGTESATSAHGWSARIAAAYSAARSVEFVRDFRSTFPGCVLSFGSLSEPGEKPRIWLRAPIQNRYELSLWLPVTFTPDYVKITSVGVPEDIMLEEYAEVTERRNGQVSIRYVLPTRRLSVQEVERLLQSKGDFRVVGIHIKDGAISGFDRYWTTRIRPIEEQIKSGIANRTKSSGKNRRRRKRPNKSPEPTTTAVTPRATE